ncbi:MAG: 3-phosphoshikimate 1-carboxyvinyltransferase [Myxococcota bacterium]
MSRPVLMRPLPYPPSFVWRVPGSKSLTNRALVLAALAEGPSTLEGVLQSDDTRHMQRCLRQLSVTITELSPERWQVDGAGRSPTDAPLFVGNSGTTVRFLTGLAALLDGQTTLEGDAHMAKRPIQDLVDALQSMGIPIDCPTGCPPLTVSGNGQLPGGRVVMRGDRSSQYFTALMMAGCAAAGPLQIAVDPDYGALVSRPYVEMTAALIGRFGGQVMVGDAHIDITPTQLQGQSLRIEPDASSASYPFAAAAATGGRITVPGLGRDALQGDVAFVDILTKMGAQVIEEDGALTVQGPQTLRGVDVDMKHISDTVMTLAAIAPLAEGPTTIRNIANIRIKETDRLAATATELRRLGQQVEAGPDWMRITPQPLRPATIDCYSDHRIAMSFAVLGLAAEGITIADPDCTAKTYPGFWDDVDALMHASRETGGSRDAAATNRS